LLVSGVLAILLVILSESLSSILLGSGVYGILFALLALALPFKFLASVNNAGLQGLKAIAPLAIARILTAVLGILCVVPLVYYLGLSGAVVGIASWAAVASLTAWFFLRRERDARGITSRGRFDSETSAAVLRFSLANLIILLLNNLALITIRTQLIHQYGASANGYYQVVWAMSSQYLILVSISLWSYSFPHLTELVGRSTLFKLEMKRILRLGLLLIGPMAYVIIVGRNFIVELLYSSAFFPSVELIPIQVWGDLFRLVIWWFELPLMAQGKLRWVVTIEAGRNVAHLLLSSILLPHLGIKGISISYTLTNLLVAAAVFLLLYKHEEYSLGASNVLLFGRVLLLLAISLFLPVNRLSWSILDTMVLILWTVWVLNRREREFFVEFARKAFDSIAR
jgi:PST family polysaccharide transporter